MGVGKTTLIKAIVKALGSEDIVTSPTYALVNEYKTSDNNIYHFDLYRIEDVEEIYSIGIEDYLYSNSYCLIEWPEKVETMLSEDTNRIFLEEKEDKLRILKLKI
jgi:tRNA threonylcarbamoyladenosine biosynthesis protein TsaE